MVYLSVVSAPRSEREQNPSQKAFPSIPCSLKLSRSMAQLRHKHTLMHWLRSGTASKTESERSAMARRSARLAQKTHSPFSELSVELQIAVLGNLPVHDLVAARFVSTTFSSLIVKSPELWRHQKVDLEEYIYRERFDFDERVDSLALFMQHGGLDALHTVDLNIDPIYALSKISDALAGLVRTTHMLDVTRCEAYCPESVDPDKFWDDPPDPFDTPSDDAEASALLSGLGRIEQYGFHITQCGASLTLLRSMPHLQAIHFKERGNSSCRWHGGVSSLLEAGGRSLQRITMPSMLLIDAGVFFRDVRSFCTPAKISSMRLWLPDTREIGIEDMYLYNGEDAAASQDPAGSWATLASELVNLQTLDIQLPNDSTSPCWSAFESCVFPNLSTAHVEFKYLDVYCIKSKAERESKERAYCDAAIAAFSNFLHKHPRLKSVMFGISSYGCHDDVSIREDQLGALCANLPQSVVQFHIQTVTQSSEAAMHTLLQYVENITDLVFCVYLSNLQHAIDALGTAQPPLKRLAIAVCPDKTRRGLKKLPDPAPYRSALGALFPNVIDISLWNAYLLCYPHQREWVQAEN